jgi:ABC-type lipopolysaccharide export system ATPase subunit
MDVHQQTILAKDVYKHDGQGVDGASRNRLSVQVRAGSVCGLLGSNSAGKTTAAHVLPTLLQRDARSRLHHCRKLGLTARPLAGGTLATADTAVFLPLSAKTFRKLGN